MDWFGNGLGRTDSFKLHTSSIQHRHKQAKPEVAPVANSERVTRLRMEKLIILTASARINQNLDNADHPSATDHGHSAKIQGVRG